MALKKKKSSVMKKTSKAAVRAKTGKASIGGVAKKAAARVGEKSRAALSAAKGESWTVRPNGVHIHPSAVLIGLTELSEHVSIWPGAVLRADANTIKIGRYVNIQDHCTLHVESDRALEIGDYTLVGHRAMLHSCTVGRACLIGIGVTILDGAVIGDGAMITAGCLIRGGKKIPPRAMVIQKDGEIVIHENKARPLTIIAASLGYAENAKRVARGQFGPATKEEEAELMRRALIVAGEIGLS